MDYGTDVKTDVKTDSRKNNQEGTMMVAGTSEEVAMEIEIRRWIWDIF